MDTQLRELTYRLIAMAPEAPPFPEESMVQLKPSPVPAAPARSRRPLMWVAVAAVIALVVVGVPLILFSGGESTNTTVPPATPTTVPDVTPTTAPPLIDGTTLVFSVYLYADDLPTRIGDPALVPVTRSTSLPTDADTLDERVRRAIESLTADTVPAGFTTAIPAGTEVLGLEVSEEGVAILDMSAEFESGGGSSSMFARLRQVVFTATQFPEIEAVLFLIDGTFVDVFSGEGIVLDRPQTRADYYEDLQAIYVETPTYGATVASPFRIAGVANVFEATVLYEIATENGEILTEGLATATCGTGCWGDFEIEGTYSLESDTSGFVTVYVASAEDGSRQNVMRYPVTLLAAEGAEVGPEFVSIEGAVQGQIVVEPALAVSVTATGLTAASIDGRPIDDWAVSNVNGVDTYFFSEEVMLETGINQIEIVVFGGGISQQQTLEVTYLPDADLQIAYLTQVGSDEIVADYIQWLTGDEANQAAFEDGVIGSVEEGVPNDYYIRNENDLLRTLQLRDEVVVVLQTSGLDGVSSIAVTLDEWMSLFKEDGGPWDYDVDQVPEWPEPHFGYFGAGIVGTPYWLILDADGTVIQIQQQYRP